MIKKVKLRDIETYAFPNREILLDYINDKHKILIAVNAEKILKDEPKLHKIINDNIGYSDGIGAVMALKQKGFDAVKIPGAELWLDIIKRFEHKKSFYIVGSSSLVIEKTVAKLKQEFPSINIVGYRDGYLKEVDRENIIKDLHVKKPDIVFIAQGSPKQEYFMDRLMREHSALYMGLGGSFDVYCGLKKRAPQVYLDLHLEWLYRLLKEPTRISRQMNLVKFLVLLIIGKV